MSKYSIRRGISDGNKRIDETESITLEHIEYSKFLNRVISDRPLQTTLDSMFLGQQHKMSSGGENIFFTNLTSGIHFFPVWQGLKDQIPIANQDITGIIPPSARIYDDNTSLLEINGPKSVDNVVDYTANTLITENISVHSNTIIPEEPIDPDDFLFYSIHNGTDATAIKAYSQKLTGLSVIPGQEITWVFEHPVEGRAGTDTFITLEIAKKGEDNGRRLLRVRGSVIPGKPYARFLIRFFTEELIAFKSDMIPTVFVIDVTPDVGALVLDRKDVPNEEVVSKVETSDLTMTVFIEWDRHATYEGLPTVNGIPVTNVLRDHALTGDATITIDPLDTDITIELDGLTKLLPVVIAPKPVILSATLSGIFPGSQTELKAGDTVDITVTVDIPVQQINFTGGLVTSGGSGFSSSTVFTIPITVNNTGITPTELFQSFTVTAIDTSDPFTTSNSMLHNDLRPSLSITSIDYPVGQTAIKDSEGAMVNNTASDFDTILYDSPNGQLAMGSVTEFTADKTAFRVTGDYNVSITNFTISANRIANDSTTIVSTIVNIAHVEAIVSVSVPTPLRSGGNDGTTLPNYTTTLTSDQRLQVAPTLIASSGTLGTFTFGATDTVFTADLPVNDTDTKGAHSFGTLGATGLAGIAVTTITGSPSYNLAGFIKRFITVPAFGTDAMINVPISDETKVDVFWQFTSQTLVRSLIPVAPQVNKFYIMNAPPETPTIQLLDTSATDSSSQTSTVEIEEIT